MNGGKYVIRKIKRELRKNAITCRTFCESSGIDYNLFILEHDTAVSEDIYSVAPKVVSSIIERRIRNRITGDKNERTN